MANKKFIFLHEPCNKGTCSFDACAPCSGYAPSRALRVRLERAGGMEPTIGRPAVILRGVGGARGELCPALAIILIINLIMIILQ